MSSHSKEEASWVQLRLSAITATLHEYDQAHHAGINVDLGHYSLIVCIQTDLIHLLAAIVAEQEYVATVGPRLVNCQEWRDIVLRHKAPKEGN